MNKSINSNVILSMAQGFSNTFLLYTACKLNLFDIISDENSTINKISDKSKINEDILNRILRPLIAYGYIAEEQSHYSLTKLGEMLRENNENSLKGFVLFCGNKCAKCWAQMPEAAIRGVSPYEIAMENNLFESNKKSKEDFDEFNAMMDYTSTNISLESFFNEEIDKESEKIIVDVGGGTGAVLIQFLNYCNNAKGVILDLDFVKEKALNNLKANNLISRSKFNSENFFQSCSISGDIYILSRILHDWSDAKVIDILVNIRKAMKEDSILYVIEQIVPEIQDKSAINIYLNDLQMWAICGGRERKLEDYINLFNKAGMYLIKEHKLDSGESILKVCPNIKGFQEGVI